MTQTEIAYNAADMLTELKADMQAELLTERDPQEREILEGIIRDIPRATYLLGVAAGKQLRTPIEGLN